MTPHVCARCGGYDPHCPLCIARLVALMHGDKDDPAGGERASRGGSPAGLIIRDTTDMFGGKP